MKKYIDVIRISYQKSIFFRFDPIINILEAILPTIALVYLWFSIYNNGGQISGYSMNQLITYFIAARLIDFLVFYPVDWELNDAIHEGKLSNLLSKPINVRSYYFSIMLGERFGNLITGVIPIAILAIIFKDMIYINTHFFNLIFGIMSVCSAMVLWFLISWLVGNIAFYLENVFMILIVKDSLIQLLSGGTFPLDFLPNAIQSILQFLPFPLLTYFPIQTLFTNSLTHAEIIYNLVLQIFWILVFGIVSKVIFNKGLKHYTSVGG